MKVASLLFKTMYFSLIFVHVFYAKNGYQRTQTIKKTPGTAIGVIAPSLAEQKAAGKSGHGNAFARMGLKVKPIVSVTCLNSLRVTIPARLKKSKN